ncbi:MAG TPA: 3-oxoacyl-[acyl-carrier-protein] synthase III C-terminal domain-containing protein, partial [Candidatus Binatia bacterium]|nr:3-oxoacyl-[acyl-carrier-protein] synthase III C-terminal domain-containing protein [Candidatus Binatia bacterium]
RFGLPPGWLENTTGVRERRWADPSVRPSDLAAAAGRRALADAGLGAGDVDVVLFTGITRDFIEPATANAVADAIGARDARVFDVTNACNGMIDGLDVADSLLRTGKARRVLVTTGERASISIDWHPRTLEEFKRAVAGLVVGDGGGALVVEGTDDPARGFREREYRSAPGHWRLAIGGLFRPTTQACEICGSVVDLRFHCDGRELFAAGLQMMPPTMLAAMERTGWTYEELTVVFCHEASKRFVEIGMAELGDGHHPGPRIWTAVERYGNTSTVSLPLQMSEARAAGVLAPGAKVLLLGGSSGISMAAVTMVW